ncbi:MAG: hypothetical protein GY943_25880, partial [Chloroflexi bacterium]|nr:hypothetical protein [Chloroflexota bacterium]
MIQNKMFKMKICIVGSFAVGKSSLVRRFVEDRFDPQYVNTIGATLKQKNLIWDDINIGMNIWDMEEGTDIKCSNYLWGTNLFLAVCDLSRLQTIPVLWSTVRELKMHYQHIPTIVTGNKVGMVSRPRVQLPDDLTESVATVFMTSVKT